MDDLLRRRTLLLGLAGMPLALSGCAQDAPTTEQSIQDSDDDGVIDSEDYAPRDPEVQDRSDAAATASITPTPAERGDTTPTATPATSTAAPLTPTAAPTTTVSPTPTRTPRATPTRSPTPSPEPLVVDDTYWQDTSHIVSYGPQTVRTVVYPDYPETDFDAARLYVALVEFPNANILDERLGARFDRSDGRREFRTRLDPGRLDPTQPYHYIVGLLPGDASASDIDHANVQSLMHTDPFTVDADRSGIARTTYDNELADDEGPTYSRNNVEGAYQLRVNGRTQGQSWTVTFFAFKASHATARTRARGRSRPEYVNFELTDGTAVELASILADEADRLGFSEFDRVEFVIDFVQSLPYVPDDVSRDFDDYTKFVLETLPEMGGDCEDTAVLLASVLQAEPFNYDTILIQPPGHMAVGLWNSNPSGYYWELDGRQYSYIETTGQGWGIGDCPDEYQQADAYLYQV